MTDKRNDYYYDDEADDVSSDPERLRRQMQREKRRRKEERRRRRYRKWLISRILIILGALLVMGLVIWGAVRLVGAVSGAIRGDSAAAATESNTSSDESAVDGNGSAEGSTQDSEAGADDAGTGAETGPYVYTEDEDTVMLQSLPTEDGSSKSAGSGEADTTDDSNEADTSGENAVSEENATEGASEDSANDAVRAASVAIGMTGEGNDYVASEYAFLVNIDTGKVLLDRDAYKRMNPASMTKVLTVLVAAEHLESEEDLKDTVTITQDIVDECWLSDSSSMYYVDGDEITVEELFYGTILPSGADAAFALANYIAGSEEAFVQLMNDRLEELGLSQTTHMTNPVGIYNEDHYSTAHDMAVILQAAMENEWCRKVLSTHTYTAAPSLSYPNGDHIISNWFLRRIEDKDTHGTVIGAKTGYVGESGHCAVSYQESDDGQRYVCCTANATTPWRAIYDHVAIYYRFTN